MVALVIFFTALALFLWWHGYVMSDGRWWVALAQPVVVLSAASGLYWLMLRYTT